MSESLTGLSDNKEMGIAAGGEQLQKDERRTSGASTACTSPSCNRWRPAANCSTAWARLVQNLNDSVEDTKKYKDNIAALSSNLEALNTVYANMLNAMGNSRG